MKYKVERKIVQHRSSSTVAYDYAYVNGFFDINYMTHNQIFEGEFMSYEQVINYDKYITYDTFF